ncbi:hypothetical protein ZWY2020_023299 [Hordeum vulgare]|nr:hypothetical protein ZWY2020_023299 [Hordeum vulgare]
MAPAPALRRPRPCSSAPETASQRLADLLPTHLPLVLKICRIFQGHAKWRYMGPPNLKEMDVMFENAHVTGETASIPGEISSSSDDDAIAEHSDVEEETDIRVKGRAATGELI